MKYRENERGGALLMVLMLIVVFTLLGMGLMSMNMSASKQFDKKEEQVQARHQAEMGFLHFKGKIREELKSYSFTKNTGETKDQALNRSREEPCTKILKIIPPSATNELGTIKYVTEYNGCSMPGNELAIKITSTGSSKHTTEKINGTATFTPPAINATGAKPVKPTRPNGYVPGSGPDLPVGTEDYVEVNGPIKTKQEEHYYKGSLVVNKAVKENPGNGNNAVNTLGVGGGHKDRLYVGKDFYIGGNLHIQNHSCIIVGGNLTILGPSEIGTQSTIIVFGDAYFKVMPDLHNNAGIYVAGKTWIGDTPTVTTGYNQAISFPSGCPKPAGWQDPTTRTDNYEWKLNDEFIPIYNPVG